MKTTIIHFCAAALLLLSVTTTFAQGWSWAKGSTGSTSEAWLVAADKSGNSFLAGYMDAAPGITIGGQFLADSANRNEMVIAKYSPSGSVLWAKQGAGGLSIPYAITTDNNGNLFVLGYYDTMIRLDTITLVNPSPTSFANNYFLAKYDPNGNILWAKNGIRTTWLGTSSNGGIGTDRNGNVYITVNNSDTTMLGGSSLVPAGAMDVVIAKYNTNGVVQWAKNIGGGGDDIPYSLSVTPNGKVYVAGTSSSNTIPFGTSTLTGLYNLFIAQLDTAGNELWIKGGYGQGDAYMGGISADSADNAYMIGTFTGVSLWFDLDTVISPSVRCVFISKFDATGNVVLMKKITGQGFPSFTGPTGYSITTDPCNNIWVCGTIANWHDTVFLDGHPLTTTPGAPDPIFVAGYDPTGLLLQSTTLVSGGDDPNLNCGIASDRQGNIFIANDNISPLFIAGTDTLHSPLGAENMYIAKYNPGLHCGDYTAVSDPVSTGKISVYPNPANSSVTISYNQAISSLTITNLLGQEVYHERPEAKTFDIDIASFSPGIYLVKVNDTEVSKLVKQ